MWGRGDLGVEKSTRSAVDDVTKRMHIVRADLLLLKLNLVVAGESQKVMEQEVRRSGAAPSARLRAMQPAIVLPILSDFSRKETSQMLGFSTDQWPALQHCNPPPKQHRRVYSSFSRSLTRCKIVLIISLPIALASGIIGKKNCWVSVKNSS